ncbi:hypothetical protein [Aquimarina pacifica]|uniref:hypothetical protein n=1 Tax=Aquimarina pacifica TaxID=1296415 RepID=UPI00047006D1|nr:hypothetical protein [Aquimarina pacifica]
MSTPKKKDYGHYKLIRDSNYVMRVYFQDGRKRTFYSREWSSSYAKHNYHPSIGMTNYQKMIEEWGVTARTVLVYHRASDTLIAKYIRGRQVSI